MTREQLALRLDQICRDGGGDSLEELAAALGLPDPRRGALNLEELYPRLADSLLLADLLLDALATADPDAALNFLERLCGGAPERLRPVLGEPVRRGQLLTLLGASPFLAGILCRAPAYLDELLIQGEIERRKDHAGLLAELRARIGDEDDFAALQAGLRRYKAREILRIGARDLCGLADLVEVTAELSDLASAALQRAYERCDALLRRETGAPLLEDEAGQILGEAEFTIFGMGKLGGRELNFSSDIDLIFFYSSDHGHTAGFPDGVGGRRGRITLHQYYVKLAEMIARALHEPTADGFVFRVDLRLRPEGERGALANSLASAEVYYEGWGQSWERAAMLKARPVAGSRELGERLLKRLEPFLYRRYLDYGMLEDIKGMKQNIDQSLTRRQEGETNLKLGRGGIREIEFFVQALQLINAGRKPRLRERSTLQALLRLHEEGLIDGETAASLRAAYIFLRTVEHRIQIEQERQTQRLPETPQGRALLARRCGFPGAKEFEQALAGHREVVNALFRDLFHAPGEELREEVRAEVQLLLDESADPDLVKDLLAEKGFSNPDAAWEIVEGLRRGPASKPLTERGRRLLARIAPRLLQEVLDSPEPEMALLNFDKFLFSLRARGAFFALLAENPEIIRLLVSLFGTSQFLSRNFIQHPEILDALVSRTYAQPAKDRARLAADLDEVLQAASDVEARLDLLRRFRNEEFLRIALHDISGQLDLREVTQQLSWLAEVCLEKALAMAREELQPRFGRPFLEGGEEAAFAVLGMGKLGGHELTYHSDLDIIFLYQGEGHNRPVAGTDPERFRPLTNHEYFARLAQKIISILTLMTREGVVYQIDTRLRPSGNQGPLVTSLGAFRNYHETSAQLWERQAMVKARVCTGLGEAFAREITADLERLVYRRALAGETLRAEIYRLRGRMESEIAREDQATFNIKTGRGGLVDVEFLAQYLQLLHGPAHPAVRSPNTSEVLVALHAAGLLDAGEFATLHDGYQFLRRLENKLRILHDHSISELSGERSYLTRLARRLGYPERPKRPDLAFLDDYRQVTEGIRRIFDRHLAPASP